MVSLGEGRFKNYELGFKNYEVGFKNKMSVNLWELKSQNSKVPPPLRFGEAGKSATQNSKVASWQLGIE